MIKTVVFDLDDTLYSELEFVISGFGAVNDYVSKEYSTHGYFEKAKSLFDKGERGTIFNLAMDELGVKYDLTIIETLVKIYREHIPNISLHNDAKWALDQYRGKKKLAIITDGNLVTQENKVESLDISHMFDMILYTDLYGRENWKPSPFPYKKIMEHTGCLGSEQLYVGDNPNKDFIAAKLLEWKTIQVCRPDGIYADAVVNGTHEASMKISSLYELTEFAG